MAATHKVKIDNEEVNVSAAVYEVIITYGIEFNINIEYIKVIMVSAINVIHI
jgi:hypothetical protein